LIRGLSASLKDSFTIEAKSGNDSTVGMNCFVRLFNILQGGKNEKNDSTFLSLSHVLGHLLYVSPMIKSEGPKSGLTYYQYLHVFQNSISFQELAYTQLQNALFLPQVLVFCTDVLLPSNLFPVFEFSVSEPIDIRLNGRENCQTKIRYQLRSAICYHGKNKDHAIAYARVDNSPDSWYLFDDQIAVKDDFMKKHLMRTCFSSLLL
jgi:hypothetical protein